MAIEWPDVLVLPLDQLFVDHEHYQRPRTTLADAIGAEFDFTLCGVLVGSQRKNRIVKGSVALIDGQQRYEGAKLAQVPSVPVVVYKGLRVEDEAYVYAEIQRKRRQMSSAERVRAMVAAGDRFPAHQVINDAVNAAGFRIGSKSAAKADPLVISSANSLERVYAWGAGAHTQRLDGGDPESGRAKLLEVLTVIRDAWPSQPDGYLGADIINGLGTYLTREYEGGPIDLNRLVKKMQRTTPQKLRQRANQLREGTSAGGSATGYMADAFLWVYSR